MNVTHVVLRIMNVRFLTILLLEMYFKQAKDIV